MGADVTAVARVLTAPTSSQTMAEDVRQAVLATTSSTTSLALSEAATAVVRALTSSEHFQTHTEDRVVEVLVPISMDSSVVLSESVTQAVLVEIIGESTKTLVLLQPLFTTLSLVYEVAGEGLGVESPFKTRLGETSELRATELRVEDLFSTRLTEVSELRAFIKVSW
jgi:hypothetical protein